jgi:hypothetical protein
LTDKFNWQALMTLRNDLLLEIDDEISAPLQNAATRTSFIMTMKQSGGPSFLKDRLVR